MAAAQAHLAPIAVCGVLAARDHGRTGLDGHGGRPNSRRAALLAASLALREVEVLAPELDHLARHPALDPDVLAAFCEPERHKVVVEAQGGLPTRGQPGRPAAAALWAHAAPTARSTGIDPHLSGGPCAIER